MTFDPRFPQPALALTPQAPVKPQRSSAARAFQVQLIRIEKLKTQLSDLEMLGQQHRMALSEQVVPLKNAHRASLREMVLVLDERLAGKTLSAPLRAAAQSMLCSMALTLAKDGDAAMATLHDRHAPLSLSALQARRAQAMRTEFEAALGERMDDLPPDASPEAVMAAARARLRQQEEDEAVEREEAAARKKARKKKTVGVEQGKAQAQQTDASELLRALFRRLASVLHPDREVDEAERERKTQLMGEANAAYARKDLVALMQLQQTAALQGADASSNWADDKLATMTLLLKAQVADLERERAGRQDALCHEFQLPHGLGATPKNMQRVIMEQVEELEMALALMQQDLRQVQEDAGFKRWVKQQHAAAERLSRLGY
jgi:hypothetical protein